MKILTALLFLSVIILSFFTFKNNSEDLKNQIELINKKINSESKTSIDSDEDFDLIGSMGKLQYFSNKLYYSLEAKNEELIDFYTHEIEETMESIEDAQVYDDGVDVSKNMSTYGVKGLENFEKFMDQNPQDFKNHYKNLINTCNACHTASEHAFIVITEPTIPAVSNQKFSK